MGRVTRTAPGRTAAFIVGDAAGTLLMRSTIADGERIHRVHSAQVWPIGSGRLETTQRLLCRRTVVHLVCAECKAARRRMVGVERSAQGGVALSLLRAVPGLLLGVRLAGLGPGRRWADS